VDNQQQSQSQPTQQAQPQEQAAPQAAAPAPQAAAPSTESSSSASSISGPSYVVKTGDTLSKIANRAQVNWHTLYAHNKKVVGANPNVIYPGQQLQLG
jgi:nucleoid-associated protein YgaU